MEGTAATFGAGMVMNQAYTLLGASNLTMVDGQARTVGVGGYLIGGGHSAMSTIFGLGADQVLSRDIVTPSGEILTANECQNTHYFFAFRGGGGSTFGVLTRATVKTHPAHQSRVSAS
jgi:FAD/FMN-containing dehydrogenase